MLSSSAAALLTATGAPTRVQKRRSKNGNLIKSQYGNGDYVEYTYNSYGQTNLIKKNGANKYYWRYNSTGMPFLHADYENNRLYTYEYDSLGRIVRTFGNTRSTGENRFSSQYTYDLSNNVTKVVNIADGNKVSTSHSYDNENRPTKTTLNSNVNYEYVYDNLGRLNYYYLNLGSTPLLVNPVYYESKRNTDGGNTYQTTQIKREEIGDRGYAYTYDKVGNIKTINKVVNGKATNDLIASYTYDALGQLKTEINVDLGQKIIYTYDNGGNIKSKKIYAYTNGTVGDLQETINYTYDSTWKDKLTYYGTKAKDKLTNSDYFTYDAIGNPLTYRDGMSFTWFGRQMQSYSKGNTSITYKYDSDGLRTQKVVNGVQYDYYYVEGQLRYEKKGDEYEIIYRYNNDGTLASVTRNRFSDGQTDILYAVTNTRGDVIELRSGSGAVNTVYTYDSWGKLISITNASGTALASTNLGAQNSIRYRGYVYDTETGLYYLQSRYYDPETGRFLNADDNNFIGVSGSVLGNNVFAYCDNNPLNRKDYNGNLWHFLIGAVAGGLVSAILTAAEELIKNFNSWKTKKFWLTVGVSAISGIVSGLLAASGQPLKAQIVGNAVSSLINGLISVLIESGKKASAKKYIVQALFGAALGAICGFLGGKGSASKHLQSSLSKVLKNGNWSYYFSQTNRESVKCGVKSIKAIIKAAVPVVVKTIRTYLKGIK